MKTELTAKRSNEYLAPVRAWVHANPGSVTKIAERLTELTGSEVHRQTVGRWLHRDAKSRHEPRLGMGLLLVEVYEELATEGEESED